MLILKQKVKKETRVDKIGSFKRSGRSKSTELSGRGRPKHMASAAQACLPCESQSRRATNPSAKKEIKRGNSLVFIPVLDKNGKSLMPCNPARARELLSRGKAKVQHLKGIFFIKMLSREDGVVQDICLGIDPGIKREAFTVKSEYHTYINILANAVTWVKDAMETKRMMRMARRQRKTPCRTNKYNRSRGSLPPSIKSRWQWKLRISKFLCRLYPITDFVAEDISAVSKKGCKSWNVSFSPLEIGKNWFYDELRKLGNLEIKNGYETKQERDKLGLKKTSAKLKDVFSAHNVDSWVLANFVVGGHSAPDNTSMIRIIPLRFNRRQLHRLQFSQKGTRNRYGGTKSGKYTRGTLVRHKKHNLCYVGGYKEKIGISLHSLMSGKRLCQKAKDKDITIICYNSWRYH
jgi:hypothetical protein